MSVLTRFYDAKLILASGPNLRVRAGEHENQIVTVTGYELGGASELYDGPVVEFLDENDEPTSVLELRVGCRFSILVRGDGDGDCKIECKVGSLVSRPEFASARLSKATSLSPLLSIVSALERMAVPRASEVALAANGPVSVDSSGGGLSLWNATVLIYLVGRMRPGGLFHEGDLHMASEYLVRALGSMDQEMDRAFGNLSRVMQARERVG